MGSVVLVNILEKIFNVIAWPPFTLVFPLYASIRAIESDSLSRNEQCLTYWILFSLITMLELVLAGFLKWLPFWPYAKGIATFFLVTPYFGGASFVYKHLIRPHVRKEEVVILSEKSNNLDAAGRYVDENVPEELEKVVILEENSGPCDDNTERDYTCPNIPMKVQKEWSCALCLVSTTSEKCLRAHLEGKKHEAKLKELKANEPATMPVVAWVNFEKLNGILGPVAKSIRWCRWKKPAAGWTKLNTDGSIDRENASFGGLLRDHRGHPSCAYICKAFRDDIFLVELWAVWRGLILASGLQIKYLWVESDSLSVVKTINKKQPYNAKALSCLQHIWKLLEKFEKYKVTHSWREANRAADHLSRMNLSGIEKSDVVLLPTNFPDSLCNIIKEDAQGRWYRRRAY